MKCKICGKDFKENGFGPHLLFKHDLSKYDYYDTYYKSNRQEGKCLTCGNKTKLLSIKNGYQKYCCRQCAYDSPIRSNTIKNTCLKRYGVSNVFKSEEIKNKSKVTCLKRYGTEFANQSRLIKDKIVRTNLKRYGVKNPQQNKKVKNKTKRTNLKIYGFENPASCRKIKEKAKKTNLKRYGVENPQQNIEIQNKTKRTNLKRYGSECTFSSSLVKKKIVQTTLERYGVKHNSQNKSINKKQIETRKINNLKKYGVSSWAKTKEGRKILSTINNDPLVREKVKRTNLERYGVENPAQDPEIHKKIFSHRKKDNHGYLSGIEYKFSKKLKDTFYFRSEYFLNGHHFDFAIFKHGKLDVLVEIDGEYFHGVDSDCDGQKVRGDKDSDRFSLVPKGVKFLAMDGSKIKEGFRELRRIYQLTYKEWINDMIKSIPKSIPYYSFSDNRMKKDYSNLCTYKYHKNANLGISTIKNFSRSLFNDIDWSERSSLIREHKLYYSPVSSHNPLDGLIEIENISRLREKYRKKYKGKKEVRIKKHTLEKMLAICSLGKRYVSKCTNKECLEESKRIIKFHKLNATLEG